jgi:hypothetical protein
MAERRSSMEKNVVVVGSTRPGSRPVISWDVRLMPWRTAARELAVTRTAARS